MKYYWTLNIIGATLVFMFFLLLDLSMFMPADKSLSEHVSSEHLLASIEFAIKIVAAYELVMLSVLAIVYTLIRVFRK